MAADLTLKQRAFVSEYIRHGGNGTKAAIAAGFAPRSAHVAASKLLKRGKVKRHLEKLTRKWEITPERVLSRLDGLSAAAQEASNFAAAVRAEELIGKSLGMWVDRSVSVNLDLTGQHVEAIRALAARRRSKSGERAGDDALEVSADVATDSDNGSFHKMGYAISDPDNREKSVINQRTTSDVLTPSTLKHSPDGGSDVDGDNI